MRRAAVVLALAVVFLFPSAAFADVTVESSAHLWTGPHRSALVWVPAWSADLQVTAAGAHAQDVAEMVYSALTGAQSPFVQFLYSTVSDSAGHTGFSYGSGDACFYTSVQAMVAPNGDFVSVRVDYVDLFEMRMRASGPYSLGQCPEMQGGSPVRTAGWHVYVPEEAADLIWSWLVLQYGTDLSGYWVEPPDEFCAAPDDLQVEALTSSSVTLSWTAVTDAHGPVQYRIYRDGVQVGSSAVNLVTIQPLVSASSSLFGVRAEDGLGNLSEMVTVSASTVNLEDDFNDSLPGWAQDLFDIGFLADIKSWFLAAQSRLTAGIGSLLWFVDMWGD